MLKQNHRIRSAVSGNHLRGEQSEAGVPLRQLSAEERVRCHLLHGQGRVRHRQRGLPACLQEHNRGILLLLSSGPANNLVN